MAEAIVASDQLAAYRAAWSDPACIRAMCDDYRTAIDVDFAHDAADLHRQLAGPALVLYGAEAAMARLTDVPALRAPRLAEMHAQTASGGHFFPDQSPEATASALAAVLETVDAQPGQTRPAIRALSRRAPPDASRHTRTHQTRPIRHAPSDKPVRRAR